MLELERFRFTVVERHVEGVRAGERAPAVVLVNLVLAHQEMHALDAPFGYLAAALERDGVIHRNRAIGLDTELLALVREQMSQFGVLQQRLGRNAADVQAHAAPVLLLDNRGLEAQLAGANGRHITARPRAQHDHIILLRHVRSP